MLNSKLGRQHTKAPLAAALSPFMSLLYPPKHTMWLMWCVVPLRNEVSEETTAEIPYWWRVTTQTWVELLIGWSKFSSPHNLSETFLDLGNDT